MINFRGPRLSYKFLRKLVLPSPQVLRKQLALAFILSLTLNILFLVGFQTYHENYWYLGTLFVLNLGLANYLLIIQTQGVMKFSTSKRRLGFSQLIVFFAYLFPLYQVYLYGLCLYRERERNMSNGNLFWKPVSVAISLTLLSLLGGAPSQNKVLSLQISPELNYIAQISFEAYQVFRLKRDHEDECVGSGNWQCINDRLKKDVFPSTNTAIILGTAVDALVTFKKKNKLQKKTDDKKMKEEATYVAAENLLVSNIDFLKQNGCHRLQAIQFISPIPLMTGPFTAYMLQFVDVKISNDFEEVATTKLYGLSQKMIKNDLPKERSRKIASLATAFKNPRSACEKN
jgi:hypothetical protein